MKKAYYGYETASENRGGAESAPLQEIPQVAMHDKYWTDVRCKFRLSAKMKCSCVTRIRICGIYSLQWCVADLCQTYRGSFPFPGPVRSSETEERIPGKCRKPPKSPFRFNSSWGFWRESRDTVYLYFKYHSPVIVGIAFKKLCANLKFTRRQPMS